MGFTDAIGACLRKYFTFSGRASRSEYWWFVVFIILGNAIFGLIDRLLFGVPMITQTGPGMISVATKGPLAGLFSLAIALPALAVGWRRMHDTGRSGLFVLYPLIVMVGVTVLMGFMAGFPVLMGGGLMAVMAGAGGIVMILAVIVMIISPLLVIWWLTRPSQPGANAYGPNPFEVSR